MSAQLKRKANPIRSPAPNRASPASNRNRAPNGTFVRPEGKPRERSHKSSVTNGNALFSADPRSLDYRTRPAMRFRDLLETIFADLGGDPEHLSEGQRQLARRAATMSLQCEIMELEAVAGREFNLDAFGQLTDRLGRCFQRLGLKRTARSVRDVTLDAVASDLKRKRNGGQDVSTA